MKLTKSQRQSHTNPFSDCIPTVNQRNTKHAKKGEYAHPEHGRRVVKENLAEYHNIEPFNGNTENVHTCHLCKNDRTSPNGFVCNNPEHLYFGTHSENSMDKPLEARKRGGKVGGKKGGKKACKKALANGNHVTQQKKTCIYCGFESLPGLIGRWHNENCKHKPMAQALMDN